jgi:hypothetical protein
MTVKPSTIRKARSFLAAAAVLGGALGTTFAALPSAHAEPPLTVVHVWDVTITGTWNPIVDDDSTIFGADFSTASSTFTKTFVMSTGAPGAFGDVWSACAGDEVNGRVFFDMALKDGYVSFQHTLDLHEGTRCNDPDIDGRVKSGVITLYASQPRKVTQKVTNMYEGGYDSATLTYTVYARQLL